MITNKLTIYEQMKQANQETDHHESDLYVKVTEASKKIIKGYRYKNNIVIFNSAIDKTPWYNILFAFDPYYSHTIKKGVIIKAEVLSL